MADPRPEDFFKRVQPGQSPMRQFVRGLALNVPTKVPTGVSRAARPQGVQSTVSGAARLEKMAVRTMIRDGEVWVMRTA